MRRIAQLPSAEREEYFREASARMGLTPLIMEKDFWVCWTLGQVFALDSLAETLLFKGGTSLSKVYQVIERFSEDVDLSIHRGSLGFSGEADLDLEDSGKQRNRKLDALSKAARAKIENEIRPELIARIEADLGPAGWALKTDESDPEGQTLLLQYPVTRLTGGPTSYIPPQVKIEFGARSDHWPDENHEIRPYLAEALPEIDGIDSTPVRVMSPVRTFWEKATILHQWAHAPRTKRLPPRYSRHYSDLAALIASPIGEMARQADQIREAVVRHKQTFYRAAWARYETATPGTLKLVPQSEERRRELGQDLKAMREMFFGETLRLDKTLDSLANWEADFNSTSQQGS